MRRVIYADPISVGVSAVGHVKKEKAEAKMKAEWDPNSRVTTWGPQHEETKRLGRCEDLTRILTHNDLYLNDIISLTKLGRLKKAKKILDRHLTPNLKEARTVAMQLDRGEKKIGDVRSEQKFADVPEGVLSHPNFEWLGLRRMKKDELLKHLPKGAKFWTNTQKYEWAVKNPWFT